MLFNARCRLRWHGFGTGTRIITDEEVLARMGEAQTAGTLLLGTDGDGMEYELVVGGPARGASPGRLPTVILFGGETWIGLRRLAL